MATEQITRADALALLASQDINEIIKPETSESVALKAFRTVRMTAGTTKMPVLSAIPTAGWVTQNGTDTDIKPTSKAEWVDKFLVAEEMAVIIPVHENTLSDSKFDIWGEVRPLVAQEFGRILDEAVLFGVNKPSTWLDPDLLTGATDAGNTVAEGTERDLAEDINQMFALVEDDEYDVNRAFTGRFLRSELRGLRDDNGQPIYLDALRSDNDTNSIYGIDLDYVKNRAWDKAKATMIAGDTTKVIIGIREDVQVKVLDQATIGTGKNQINLAERDMVALRFKFRVGYALGAYGTDGDDQFPFAVLTPADGDASADGGDDTGN